MPMTKKMIFIISSILVSCFILVSVINSESLKNPSYVNITLDEYKDKLDNKEDFIIYVYKASCAVCNQVRPYVNNVIDSSGLLIYAMDADEEGNLNVDFFESQNLEHSPTFIFYEKGIEDSRLVGYQTEDEIRAFFTKNSL